MRKPLSGKVLGADLKTDIVQSEDEKVEEEEVTAKIHQLSNLL